MSYRTRKFFRGLATVLLIALLVGLVVWVTWIVWLDRFVVYSRDGAQILFDSPVEDLTGEEALPPDTLPPVSIRFDSNAEDTQVSTELAQIQGYYVDAATLQADIAAVRSQIEQLPAGTAIMLDVKDIYGYCFYSSQESPSLSGLDIQAVDELISYVTGSGFYTIARLPAFQDYWFGLNKTTNGLYRTDGYALWNDRESGRLTYWLDPSKDGTVSHLTQLITELKRLGFDEVVLSDFRFPNTTDLAFSGDRSQAIADAADAIAMVCSTDRFCVSFETASSGFPLPEGERCRLYFTGVAAVDAPAMAASLGLEDPAPIAVFLTELGDTRFNEYSVLRPLSSARPTGA